VGNSSRIREAAWEFAIANRLDTEQMLPPDGQQELFSPNLVWHDERNVEDVMNDNYTSRPATTKIPDPLRRFALPSDN
jgi:hypothetical protein